MKPLWTQLVLGFLICIFFQACVPEQQEDQQDLPNIVLILADDMGYGDIKAYNLNSALATPNLDELAAQGMRFTDAHSGSSVCTPTRYGLMTGSYAWRTRLKKGVLSGYSQHLIEPSQLTLASLLKEKNYHTGVVGKWHLGVDFPWTTDTLPKQIDNLNYYLKDLSLIDYSEPIQNGPNTLGFDYSFLVPGSLDMSPYVYLENGKATTIPDSISPLRRFPDFVRQGEIAPDFTHEGCLDRLTEKATNFIAEQAQSQNPFFLYFPLTGPHKPALAATRFKGKSGIGPYGDLVLQVDWTVGEVLNTLRENGVEENTLVIYTSDNGSYMYRLPTEGPDHVEDSTLQGFHVQTHQSNDRWRGTKADIWEAGHRVPFLVRWPDKVRPGSTQDTTVCLTDVMATIAEILAIDLPQDEALDSHSFLPLLTGMEGFERPPVVHHSVAGMFSIRHNNWKLVLGNGSGGRQQPRGKPFEKPYQLYDLAKDPEEKRDLSGEELEVMEALEKKLEEIRAY
ncbi:MAG: arylsulfatase [Bacteroidota bacterium]